MKKFLSLMLVMLLILGSASMAWGAEATPVSVYLKDQPLLLSPEAYLNEEGLVMVPLRKVVESFGYTVYWDPTTQGITLTKGTNQIQLTIGKAEVKIQGKTLPLAVAPVILENTTFVPVSFLDQDLGLVLGWESPRAVLRIRETETAPEDFFTPGEDKEITQRLHQYLQALAQHHNFHGSVLVAQNNQVLLNQGYGYSDFQQGITVNPQTRFAIGSVTKQFTALAVMQLKEQGFINLQDTVSTYLPDFPHGDVITLHHLLTHTSGLVNYTNLNESYALSPEQQDAQGIIDSIRNYPLSFAPGSKYEYCNTGYLALGLIVETVSGQSLGDYFQTHIFTPLNMKNTGFAKPGTAHSYDATAYVGYLDVMEVDDAPLISIAHGAGSLYSTVEDLYRWDRALAENRLVKEETLAEILTGHVEIEDPVKYGYGWVVVDFPDGSFISHEGNTFGFSASIARFLDLDLTIIALTNSRYYDLANLINALTTISLGGAYELPKPVAEITPEDSSILQEYVGSYRLEDGSMIYIKQEEDQLYIQVPGDAFQGMYMSGPDAFFLKIVDAKMAFTRNEAGVITHLALDQNGIHLEAEKVADLPTRTIGEVDPAHYDALVGTYAYTEDENLEIIITREGDQLFAQLTAQAAFEIFPESPYEYFYQVVEAQITFIPDETGAVNQLVLKQGNVTLTAQRIQ